MCAGIVSGTAFTFPVGGGSSSSASGTIVDSNCDNGIVVSGELEPQSPGFKGEYQLTYGTLARIYAGFVSLFLARPSLLLRNVESVGQR